MKKKSPIPFSFVIDSLFPIIPEIRAMFGCHALYRGQHIVLILRKRNDHSDDNGIWLATDREHHVSLKKEFPSMRSIRIFGPESNWQNLPEESDDFEVSVLHACELIRKSDPRIGRIPVSKKKKKK
jgi:hypothetical protein